MRTSLRGGIEFGETLSESDMYGRDKVGLLTEVLGLLAGNSYVKILSKQTGLNKTVGLLSGV